MQFNFIPFPRLETSRLILRKATYEDSKEIFFLRTDPVVNKYVQRPTPKDLGDVELFIQNISKGIENGDNLYWAITLKGTTNLIGTFSLWNFSADRKIAEVGYDLMPDYYNRGIMSEALKCGLDFGFGKLKFEEVQAYTHFENTGSVRLLKKYNFSLIENKKDEDNPNNIIFSLMNKDYLYNQH